MRARILGLWLGFGLVERIGEATMPAAERWRVVGGAVQVGDLAVNHGAARRGGEYEREADVGVAEGTRLHFRQSLVGCLIPVELYPGKLQEVAARSALEEARARGHWLCQGGEEQ